MGTLIVALSVIIALVGIGVSIWSFIDTRR
jgi:hypothetical protein